MKPRFAIQTIGMVLAAAGAATAQQWEFGGMGGAGFLKNVPVTGVGSGAATAGFRSGAAFGGFFGQNLYRHLSGEVHYSYLRGDMRIASGGSEATFRGVSHVVHYDLILHTNRRRSKVQAFAAVGGGMRLYRGTGKEAAYQPLSQYAIFTRTQAIKPMASVGGGVKIALAPNVFLRTEFRDYITMFPEEVLTPAPGAKISGLLHDFVPMVGLSFTF
jgi:hypothetical protein